MQNILTDDRSTRIVRSDGNTASWTVWVMTEPQIHTTTAEHMTVVAHHRLLHLVTTNMYKQIHSIHCQFFFLVLQHKLCNKCTVQDLHNSGSGSGSLVDRPQNWGITPTVARSCCLWLRDFTYILTCCFIFSCCLHFTCVLFAVFYCAALCVINWLIDWLGRSVAANHWVALNDSLELCWNFIICSISLCWHLETVRQPSDSYGDFSDTRLPFLSIFDMI